MPTKEMNKRDEKIVQYLNDAYATERRLEIALQAHIAMTPRADYKKRLREHLKETKAHARASQRRIKALGGEAETVSRPGPEAVVKGATGAKAAVQRAAAVAQGPLHAVRGTGQQERMLKNARTSTRTRPRRSPPTVPSRRWPRRSATRRRPSSRATSVARRRRWPTSSSASSTSSPSTSSTTRSRCRRSARPRPRVARHPGRARRPRAAKADPQLARRRPSPRSRARATTARAAKAKPAVARRGQAGPRGQAPQPAHAREQSASRSTGRAAPQAAASAPGPGSATTSRGPSSAPHFAHVRWRVTSPPQSRWRTTRGRRPSGRVVAVAPLQQGHHDRPQIEALLGQPVLEARGALLVGHALEDALVDEAAEAVGEHVARDAEVALEVVEAAHAHERLAHDEDRPAVAEHLERRGRSSSSGLRRYGAAWLGFALLAAGPSTGPRDQCSPMELRHATHDGRVGCMKQRWKVLLVTSVAVFMGFLDVTIVNIAFPDIEASFPGTSLAGLSWILNAYNIVFAALLVPAGRLSDRLGRRRMFFVGVSTFLAASAVCGLAPSVEVLVGRARRAGRGRRDPRPDLAGAAAPRVPARAARDGDRALGRHRRHRGRRPARPSAASSSRRRAGAGSSSSTSPSACRR